MNRNKRGHSDYPPEPREFLRYLRGAALEVVVLCEVGDVAQEVYGFASGGAHVSFQSLAVPSIVKGNGKDDLPSRELDIDHRIREQVFYPYQEVEDIVLGDELDIGMTLAVQFGDVSE